MRGPQPADHTLDPTPPAAVFTPAPSHSLTLCLRFSALVALQTLLPRSPPHLPSCSTKARRPGFPCVPPLLLAGKVRAPGLTGHEVPQELIHTPAAPSVHSEGDKQSPGPRSQQGTCPALALLGGAVTPCPFHPCHLRGQSHCEVGAPYSPPPQPELTASSSPAWGRTCHWTAVPHGVASWGLKTPGGRVFAQMPPTIGLTAHCPAGSWLPGGPGWGSGLSLGQGGPDLPLHTLLFAIILLLLFSKRTNPKAWWSLRGSVPGGHGRSHPGQRGLAPCTGRADTLGGLGSVGLRGAWRPQPQAQDGDCRGKAAHEEPGSAGAKEPGLGLAHRPPGVPERKHRGGVDVTPGTRRPWARRGTDAGGKDGLFLHPYSRPLTQQHPHSPGEIHRLGPARALLAPLLP